MSESQGIRVFVYGTLKQGRPNHDVLKGAELLGRCTVKGKVQMLDLGYYPGMVMTPGKEPDRKVLGEVYRVSRDTLTMLDFLEGHPHYYARHKVQTPWKGAWCYFLPMAYRDHAKPVEEVSGVQVWKPSAEEGSYVSSDTKGI